MSLILFESLRSQQELSGRLAEYSARQKRALETDELDALLALLREKQSLIDRIQSLNDAARVWKQRRHEFPSDERDAGDEAVRATDRALTDSLRCDEECVQLLTRHREETRRELGEVSNAGRVHTAYLDTLAPLTHRSLNLDL